MSSPKLHWFAYLWPGLPQVWTRGSWAGLAVAVGFTALANALAAATFVWDEWLSDPVRWTAWSALGIVWLLAWLDARADWRRRLTELSAGAGLASDPAERCDHWFREAQAAYLTGDWVASEQTLLKLLKLEPRDAEARLLLATLWRHEGRLEVADAELDRLELLESAAPWRHEIAQERERIAAACVLQMHSAPAEGAETNSDATTAKYAA
jgi:tetratricopeptide (TPR) repeat protein